MASSNDSHQIHFRFQTLEIIILDPNFAKLHIQKSPKNTHTILTALNDEDDTMVVTPYPVRSLLLEQSCSEVECCYLDYHSYFIVGSTNGLVCLAVGKSLEDRKYELFIKFWNPSLRLRSRKAPSMNIELYGTSRLGFGYDDLNDTYKSLDYYWKIYTQKKNHFCDSSINLGLGAALCEASTVVLLFMIALLALKFKFPSHVAQYLIHH
ncbi:transmembrane protein, putative [Medicago truncatula]|uniref:Transmembrane protein, putative n=1 Tax=Medicago truncatula TaxID=3880 RepID=A0A072THE4_MEDTR|nr:transmembrane protein, putative [Medicago truncatula]